MLDIYPKESDLRLIEILYYLIIVEYLLELFKKETMSKSIMGQEENLKYAWIYWEAIGLHIQGLLEDKIPIPELKLFAEFVAVAEKLSIE